MLPLPHSNDAVFLDFDGTLVEIARTPASVVVSAELRQLLGSLAVTLDGALAIISGRPITNIDLQLQPLKLAAAGEHGAELRPRPEAMVDGHAALPADVAAVAKQIEAECPGVLVELKTASTSVHYRQAPQHEATVVQRMEEVARFWPDYELLHGKMVVEFKPGAVNKGLAIRALAAQSPFVGRRPVFIGDDTTDEAGFVVVNELGGLSMRVGDLSQSAASYQLENVAAVHAWLGQLQ